MSQEERKLLQLMDERILNASPEELPNYNKPTLTPSLMEFGFMIFAIFQIKCNQSRMLQPTNFF